MAKIGENAISDSLKQGLDELRAANSGQLAMDAPPIQPIEAPVVEQAPNYSDMLNQAASRQGQEQDLEMER